MIERTPTILRTLLIVLTLAVVTRADGPFSIEHYTIDGGGGACIGGAFELAGTIARPDAGEMYGGEFELTGGFWSATSPTCACAGDMNADGLRNGADIASFVTCFVAGESCQCADIDGTGGVTIDDIDAFVAELLTDGVCP